MITYTEKAFVLLYVSFIAVLGKGREQFPMRYCGWFTSLSVNIWCFKGLLSGAISIGNGVTIDSLGVVIGAATLMKTKENNFSNGILLLLF
jgi:hypothetical protein